MPQRKKTKTKPPSAAKSKRSKGIPQAARRAEAAGGANGLPPAPLVKLTENETKKRLKVIIGAESGENPANIGDDSPIRRANVLLPRLRSAINRHFFPAPLNGIVGFPASETVRQCAQRIKRTRDPQIHP